MTKQEYLLIRNLSWDLLIDTRAGSLPIDIFKVASVYGFESQLSETNSLYKNTLIISKLILNKFGISTSSENCKCLSIRVLAPAIVLKELRVKSAEEVTRYTHLPQAEAVQRFKRLQELLARDKFETSGLESIVLEQFEPWLNSISSS